MVKHDSMNSWIDNFMLRIGIKPKFLGYSQLKQVILMRLEQNYAAAEDLYETVSVSSGTSPSAVERNIRTAIQSAYESNMLININELMKINLVTPDICLTNGELISYVALFARHLKSFLS